MVQAQLFHEDKIADNKSSLMVTNAKDVIKSSVNGKPCRIMKRSVSGRKKEINQLPIWRHSLSLGAKTNLQTNVVITLTTKVQST